MKIAKHYDTTLSHKFPNGDIATVRLGTLIEVDTVLDTASDSDIDKFSAKLSKRTYKLTMKDIKRFSKEDPLVKAVCVGVQEGMQIVDTEKEAMRILEENDD